MRKFLPSLKSWRTEGLLLFIPLLVSVYFYIFFVLLNHENAWMHKEIVERTQSIFSQNGTLKDRWLQGFNWSLIEFNASRPRILSHLVLVANMLFRNWLFHYIVPHPSLSVTWLAALFLSPYFLYRLILNLFNDKKIALAACVIYLCLPGNLIPIIMLFHPGKAFSNLFFIICLYRASNLWLNNQRRQTENFKRDFLILASLIYLSFFFDEYSLFIYFLIPLFFPSIFYRPSLKFASLVYAAVPLAFFISVVYLLPALYSLLHFPGFNFFSYVHLNQMPAFDIHNSLINFVLLLHDNLQAGFNAYLRDPAVSLAITNYDSLANRLVHSENIFIGLSLWNDQHISFCQIFHNMIVFLVVLMLFNIFLTSKKTLHGTPSAHFLFKSIAAMFLYAAFFSLLHIKSNILAGCGWYGCSFSVLFALLAGCVFNILKNARPAARLLAPVLLVSLVTSSLWNTRLLNYAWLVLHYKENYYQLDMWLNKYPRLALYQKYYLPKEKTNFKMTRDAWALRSNPAAAAGILSNAPKDVKAYLFAELPYIR